MKEERMKILQMVEDGKITVEEAGKLLDNLNASDDYDGEVAEKFKEYCKETESFLKNVLGKIGDFAKDVEPRVRNVTKTAVTKTAEIVDELGKALAACLNSLADTEPECDGSEKCGCGCNEEESREN